jgi:hypothetical protein
MWIEQYLRPWTSTNPHGWAKMLPIAEFAHNSWKHEGTQKSPHQLLMGFNPQVNITLIEDDVPEATQRIRNLEEYRWTAQDRLEAIQNMRDGRKDVKFEEGNQVWLEAKNLPLKGTWKLMPEQYGPFTIEKKISPVAFRLTLPPSMKIHNVFHADLLLPYKETEEYGQPYTRPPPVIEEGEENYEINAILDARQFRQG